MILRIISGGQTGVDQAGLRAARTAGIATGGWAPRGWATEAGPAPWLADYGLVECETPGYPARTRSNVRDSDATLWFGDWVSPGGAATLDACRQLGRPWMIVYNGVTKPSDVALWLQEKGVRVVNIAGNRESKAPGIGERVERFLGTVLRTLARDESGESHRLSPDRERSTRRFPPDFA